MKVLTIVFTIFWGICTLWGVGATIGLIDFSEPVKFPISKMLIVLGMLIALSMLL